jgi:hypothetical protein
MPVKFQMRDRVTEPRSNKPRWVTVKRAGKRFQDPLSGKVFEVFRIQVFAEALNRTTHVIKRWIREKHLPRALFVVEGDNCKSWFSESQIMNAHRIMIHRYGGRKYFASKGEFLQFVNDLKAIWYQEDVTIDEEGKEIRT